MTIELPVFMALEPLLVQRIQDEVTQFPGLKVLDAAELSQVSEKTQPVPAVHVIYDGYQVSTKDGMVSLTERYITVVAVRNVRTAKTGKDARAEAGPIMSAVFAALLGWQPKIMKPGVKPLVSVPPVRPGFNAGYGYYPQAWEAQYTPFPAPCLGLS